MLSSRRARVTVSLPTVDKLFISANSLLRDSMELARLVVSSGFQADVPGCHVARRRAHRHRRAGSARVPLHTRRSHRDSHLLLHGHRPADKTVRVHAIDYLVSRLSADDELLLVDDVFDSGRSLEAVIRELKQRCRRNWPEKWRIATVYYKSTRNRSALVPDYYVLDTDKWLVFPHELIGLTREEILEHKPVGARLLRNAMNRTLAGPWAVLASSHAALLAQRSCARASRKSAWSSSIRTLPGREGRTSCR